MDGKDYTFNGWGEYEMVYMKDGTFRMQIRIEDAVSNGFAMKSSESSIVEVSLIE